MSGIDSLRDKARSKQEEAVTASAPVFIRACPGAGKTRVLVERHFRTGTSPRRTGRALLSFTNVAADELRDRCDGNRPDLTAFPHYIGTFDRFLWRYLVRPFLPAGPTWRHLHSWDQVPSAVVGHRKVPLSEFRFDYDPSTKHTQVRWPKPGNRLTNSGLTADSYCVSAKTARDRLQRDHGYMTGHEIRVAALNNVKDPSVTELLRHRFFEIVMDEAQDCSKLDLTLLDHLHDAELPLVVVADPDQGIYEWNDARPQELLTLTQRLPHHVELNGNWRSSAPICRLAATLRPASHTVPDLSVGTHHAVDNPVVLLPYGLERGKSSGLASPENAVEAFTELAAQEGIEGADCLVLAHSNASVPKIRSTPVLKAPKKPDTVALAWAAAVLGTGEADRNTREQALEIAARLLNAYWHPESSGSLSASLLEHGIAPALMCRSLPRCPSSGGRHSRRPVAQEGSHRLEEAKTTFRNRSGHPSGDASPGNGPLRHTDQCTGRPYRCHYIGIRTTEGAQLQHPPGKRKRSRSRSRPYPAKRDLQADRGLVRSVPAHRKL
jgi:hypothetical protein